MKRFSAFITTVLAAVMLAFAAPAIGYADEADGVTVTLATDKDAYAAGETVKLTVEIENASNAVATDVSWRVELPEGVSVDDETALSGTVEEIRPHMTWTSTFTGQAEHIAGTGGTTPTTGDTTSDTGDTIPATGDSTLAIVGALVVGGAVVVGLGIVCRKRAARTLAILVLAVGLAGAAALPARSAYADETQPGATGTCAFTVDGVEQIASVSASYTLTGDDGSGDGNRVHFAYTPGTVSIEAYEGAGSTVSFPADAYNVKVGDIVALTATDANPEGGAGTVGSVSTVDGVTTITFEQATEATQVFKTINLDVYSTVDFSDFEPADGVVIDDTPEIASRSARAVELPKLKLKVNKKLGKNAKIEGTVKFGSTLDFDFDWSWTQFLKKCSFELENDLDLKVSGKSERKLNVDPIKLNKNPIRVPLTHGLYATFNLSLDVSFTGEVSLKTELTGVYGLEYTKKKGFDAIAESDADVSLDANAKLKGYIAPYVGLELLKLEIIDVQFGGGVAGDVTHVTRPTGMVCDDLDAYVGCEISCGENTGWMKKVGLTFEKEIWNEKTSPFSLLFHYEDGELVDECTWKEEKPEEPENPDIPENPDDPDEPENPENPGGDVTETSDFIYYQAIDGTIEISGYTGESADVVVPVEIDGIPVGQIDLMAIDASACPEGISLSFEEGSQVTSLSTWGLDESDAKIVALDLSNAKELVELNLREAGSIPVLDLTGLTKLEKASFNANDADYDRDTNTGTGALEKVVISGNTALTNLTIEASSAKVEAINLAGAPNLEYAVIGNCGVRSLTLSNEFLKMLDVYGTQLKVLDLSGCSGLWAVDARFNKLTSVTFHPRGFLARVDLSYNLLETLDVSPLAKNQFVVALDLCNNRLPADEVARLQAFHDDHFPDSEWDLDSQSPA